MRRVFIGLTLAVLAVAWLSAQGPYYPPSGQWAHKSPGEVGMDAAKLDDAVAFMKAHETNSPTRDFSDQEIVNGKLLASIPTERAGTNALIIRHGYIVGEFGDTTHPIRLTASPKACCRRWPASRSIAAIQGSMRPSAIDPRRQLRFAAQQGDHLAQSPAAGIRVARHDVHEERRFRGNRSVWPRRKEAA
jgi:hypothetical protein